MTDLDLQKMCRLGDISKIKEILKSCPDLLNQPDKDLGWPPLYRTVICGHLEASRELLVSGANPNVKNRLGDSPLHQAVETNQIALVNLLLDFGADSNIQQNDGDTPLHYSCLKEFVHIALLLLKYRANPNLQDFVFGKTALHLAVECKNQSLIQILIRYNARPEVQDYSGRTPLDMSEELRAYLENDLGSKQSSIDLSEPKHESFSEPESASHGFQNNFTLVFDPHKNSMYKWLTSMKLEFLFAPLYENGYDDLDFLLAQIRSTEKLTSETLREIGIEKLGHRLKLLALLEEEAFKDVRNSSSVGFGFLCNSAGRRNNDLTEWLRSGGVENLVSNFTENGIEDFESLWVIMQSRFGFSEETLKTDLGIKEKEERLRVLKLIKEHSRHRRIVSRISFEKDEPILACEFCGVI